nr:hypothetical protein Iba_chr14fCG9990 [Ipomoea batatas]
MEEVRLPSIRHLRTKSLCSPVSQNSSKIQSPTPHQSSETFLNRIFLARNRDTNCEKSSEEHQKKLRKRGKFFTENDSLKDKRRGEILMKFALYSQEENAPRVNSESEHK